MSQTREQQRALTAHKQVDEVPNNHWDEYRTATLKAQALIRNAGLCQALHYLQNKDKEDGSKRLVADLQTHLKEGRIFKGNDLLTEVRNAKLPAYLLATREALQCLTWQCRMVEALKQVREAAHPGKA
jgi:CRISPR type III-B/RAMP module-associated protein Cmr5